MTGAAGDQGDSREHPAAAGFARGSVELTIGSEVSCSDGACGELRRVVVDPLARTLTHLVVEPRDQTGTGRLVPIELVDSTADGIALRCTLAQFGALEEAEEARFVTGAVGDWGYQQEQMLSLPYYGLGVGTGMGLGIGGMHVGGANAEPPPVITDRVPLGEVEVRRNDQVHATDGAIGRIEGLVVDRGDGHVTHVLLQEGHLFGKKEVAIPIGAVEELDPDGVRLSLTRDQVRDLPPVELERSA